MSQEDSGQTIPEVTCQEVVAWASAYLDDHVGDDRTRQIILHLTICAGCETYVKQIAAVRDTLGLLPKADMNPKNLPRLQQAFAERVGRPSSRS